MFEAKTYDALMEEALAQAPEGIDTRQGSIFFDSVSAAMNIIARLYADIDKVFELVFFTTASGEYLDEKAAEYGLSRQAATPAKYRFEYTGTTPDTGERFFHQETGYYFVLYEDDLGVLYLEAETAGIACNDIASGDVAVPVNTVVGLTSATFGNVYEYGTDAESDDDLKERMMEKVAGPAENGNKAQYKTWCESITGVGRARIVPLWNGENTVKAVLISPLGLPVSHAVEREVQQYIDPNDLGMTAERDGKTYNVGDGLGNGVANIGAHFTAVTASELGVNITFKAELAAGRTTQQVEEAVRSAVTSYLRGLVLDAGEDEAIVVRINAIGAILAGLTGYLVDYTDLRLNGDTGNLAAGSDEVPVLGEVGVDAVS